MKLAKTNNLPLDQFINFALYDKEKMEILLLLPISQDYFQRLLQFGQLLFGKV